MKRRTLAKILLLTAASSLLAACASNTTAQDTLNEQRCPPGQVLVCKGGEANSRVKDSKLNETDICICRQKDTM